MGSITVIAATGPHHAGLGLDLASRSGCSEFPVVVATLWNRGPKLLHHLHVL
jgi:hypothetical protein